MKAINFIVAVIILLAASPLFSANLVDNGNAESGYSENFFNIGQLISPGHFGKFAFACPVEKNSSMVMTSELIPVDPKRKYQLSGWFKSGGSGSCRFFFGVIPYDANRRVIYSEMITAKPDSVTVLAAPCYTGDTAITVKDASKWTAGRFFVPAFKNGSDWQIDLGGTIDKIEPGTDGMKIFLNRGLNGFRAAGTPVRMQQRSFWYMCSGASNAALTPEWKKFQGSITGTTANVSDFTRFRPGTAWVRIFVSFAGGTENPAGSNGLICFDDIIFEEINK